MILRRRYRTALGIAALMTSALWLEATEPAEQPSLDFDPDRGLVLTGLPEILGQESIEPQLTKGLTTTFVFRVDLLGRPNAKNAGGARVEIRYELWDEVFQVRVLEIDGQTQQAEFGSRELLSDWWRGARLTVVPVDLTSVAKAERVRVKLEVVPFSQAEQADTQEWFSQSVASAELARSEGVSTSVSGSEKRGSGVFSILIATSIRSRPLTTFSWTVDLPRETSP